MYAIDAKSSDVGYYPESGTHLGNLNSRMIYNTTISTFTLHLTLKRHLVGYKINSLRQLQNGLDIMFNSPNSSKESSH